MFTKNPILKVFTLILTTFLFLLLLSFLPKNFTIFGFELKPVDLISDLKEQEVINYQYISESEVNNTTTPQKEINFDDLLNENTVPIENFNTLENFYNKLKNFTDGCSLRIAYFGDSMIEGDLFTDNMRNYLQKKFGGSGIGFLPITNNNTNSWGNVTIKHCGNYLIYNLINKKPANFNFGINGYIYLTDTSKTADSAKTKKEYWTEYSGKNFTTAKVYYSSYSDSSYLTYTVNNVTKKVFLGKNLAIAQAEITNINSNKIRFNFYGQLALYGVSFDNSKGIFVDNYAIRGHNGLNLVRINKNTLQAFNSYFNYDLIILQFGANVIDESVQGYGWYKKGLVNNIQHLKSAFPNASILIVGAADRSKKDINGFSTIQNVISLIDAQKVASKETNVAFWDMFKAMGGVNSMPVWVNKNMAALDYTHFNHSGASALSKKLTLSLLQNL